MYNIYNENFERCAVVKEYAYAKINLYLDVLVRRENGFHDILSVMHTTSLCDTVTVYAKEAKETKITLSVKGADLPLDKNNIAYLAAEAYLEKSKLCSKINIEIEKNIPIGAGLAGGSADAAAVLRALNKIYNRLTIDELLEIAEGLGSDVPFCLVGGSALCEGRGEIMTPINVQPKNLVIAIGEERVNTKEAYAELDRIYNNFENPHSGEELKKRCLSNPHNEALPYNIFEEVAPNSVKKLKERLSALSATAVLMSGSGPSVFGIFESEEEAKKAEETLKNEGYTACYAKSIIDNLL